MKLFAVLVVCLFLTALTSVGRSSDMSAAAVTATDGFETRCGWFDNPTPANIYLLDREAEWTIEEQGGYYIEKEWDWPAFKGQWVLKNTGSYGYGCACLRLRVDAETHQVLEIKSARARPLSACRRDRALLKKWRRLG